MTVNQTYVIGGINQNATGVGLSNVVLELKVPVSFLSYQWLFNVSLK